MYLIKNFSLLLSYGLGENFTHWHINEQHRNLMSIIRQSDAFILSCIIQSLKFWFSQMNTYWYVGQEA